MKELVSLSSINNTIRQSVDASLLVDSDKGKKNHCSGKMLLCTLKIRLFRVESKGLHIINVTSDCPQSEQGQFNIYPGEVKVTKWAI